MRRSRLAEELQRNARVLHRERIIPLANNPAEFSNSQLMNFLQNSALSLGVRC
jgi:hypothetical protein